MAADETAGSGGAARRGAAGGGGAGEGGGSYPSASSASNDRYQAFLKVHRENKARLKALSPQALETDTGARLGGEYETDSKVKDHMAQILDLASPNGAATHPPGGGEAHAAPTTDTSLIESTVLALSSKLNSLLSTRAASGGDDEAGTGDVEVSNTSAEAGGAGPADAGGAGPAEGDPHGAQSRSDEIGDAAQQGAQLNGDRPRDARGGGVAGAEAGEGDGTQPRREGGSFDSTSATEDAAERVMVGEQLKTLQQQLDNLSGLQEAATIGAPHESPPPPTVPPPVPPLDTSASDDAFKRDLTLYTDLLRSEAEKRTENGMDGSCAFPVVIKEPPSGCNSPIVAAMGAAVGVALGDGSPGSRPTSDGAQGGAIRAARLAVRLNGSGLSETSLAGGANSPNRTTEEQLEALGACQTELANVRRFLRLFRGDTDNGGDNSAEIAGGMEVEAFAARAQVRRRRLLVEIPRLELAIERSRREEDKKMGSDVCKERFVMKPGQVVHCGKTEQPLLVRILRQIGCTCLDPSLEQELDRQKAADISGRTVELPAQWFEHLEAERSGGYSPTMDPLAERSHTGSDGS